MSKGATYTVIKRCTFSKSVAHTLDTNKGKNQNFNSVLHCKEIVVGLLEESGGTKQENIRYQGGHELKRPCWIHKKRWHHRNYYGADCPADDKSSKSGRDGINKTISNRATVTFYVRICGILAYPVTEALTTFCILSLRK